MFLGIDCGTQGTKSIVVDEYGKRIGRGYAPHALIEQPSGAREQDPQWWVDAMVLAVQQALAGVPDRLVHALGVSGQQHGLVVLDSDKNVIRPAKLWNDTETAPHNLALIERFGGSTAFFNKFGIVPLTGYTVSKLLWLKENEPQNFDRIRHILLPHEYLNYWLTGRMCAEFGDASGTAFFDVRTRAWIKEILDEIDGGTDKLYNALPQLIGVDESVGTVRPEVASILGLTSGCMVSSGGGDNMMGAIGTGNVREGVVTLSLGTSSTVYTYSERPGSDPTGCVAPFCSSSGGWLPLICTMNATNVVTQTLQVLGKTVQDIEDALGSTRPGADGLTFLPFLNGERTPDLPQAKGSLVGISSSNFTSANMIRSVIEGVSFGILNGLDLISGGNKPAYIVVIGGGSRSIGWRQLLSDAIGTVVRVPLEEEAGCLGASLQAMYIYKLEQGAPESFWSICDSCIEMNESDTVFPRSGLSCEYQQARKIYDARLREHYRT
jgi:xylulokinase